MTRKFLSKKRRKKVYELRRKRTGKINFRDVNETIFYLQVLAKKRKKNKLYGNLVICGLILKTTDPLKKKEKKEKVSKIVSKKKKL